MEEHVEGMEGVEVNPQGEEETPKEPEVKTESPTKTEAVKLAGKRLMVDEMKFMKDFDPNQRLIKKKMKKFTETGIIIERCDCLIENCPGCHYYPCPSCGSHLCGVTCRVNRGWDYKELEIQGCAQPETRTRVEK